MIGAPSNEGAGAAAAGASAGNAAGASAGQHKKKRFHGNAAAAMAARRAGHAVGPAGSLNSGVPGGNVGGANDDEAAFISSSRDASEEDNDDASGYSDSASSLRQFPTSHHVHHRLPSPLPQSAHDQAVADSRDTHRVNLIRSNVASNPSADKTPLSTSPSRSHLSSLTTQIDGSAPVSSQIRTGPLPSTATTLPTEGVASDPRANALLSHAAAALVSSNTADLVDGQTAEDGIVSGGGNPERIAGASVGGRLAMKRQESSAGSEASDVGPRRDRHTMSLGTLPPAEAFASSQAHLNATTPRAPESALPPALSTIREARKGKSTTHASDDRVASSSLHQRSETDDGSANENTTTNPYDGDVEYAAPNTHTNASGAGQTPGQFPASNNPVSPSALPAAAAPVPTSSYSSHVTSTAPSEVPSGPFVPAAGADDHHGIAPRNEDPIKCPTANEIRSTIHKAIHQPHPLRTYQINPPVDGGKNPARPIRIYADGVYDLFHYAHMLQLRQAKLSFGCVYLIVGVVSSEACAAHKNEPVMTSQERYASVRNCRWVDEVVEDAPWVITQELLDKYQIDYVAHDDLPYAGAGSSAGTSDIYQFCKDQGRFLPTQRTEGVSTSELLARIVEQYRNHNYDQKLAKIGHKELAFE